MPDRTKTYDVLVAGGGNAALCAAITARQAGASVLLVESAPKAFRGGNSRHTRNLRAMHDRPERGADRCLQGRRILGRPVASDRRQHR